MKIRFILMLLTLILYGCINNKNDLSDDKNPISLDPTCSNLFSNRDFEVDFNQDEFVEISLNHNSITCSSKSVQIIDSILTITEEGYYLITGELEDGMIIINCDKEDKVQLVLDNVTIHSETSAPIYVLQADKVFITTLDHTINRLSNGGEFQNVDENPIDAVIFSKEDLTLNGSGSLKIISPAGHGIVSKDSLKITGGSYDINSASHGLVGKDDLCIADGDFEIISGKDAIHSENKEDSSLGLVYILEGYFDINSEGDGISAYGYMQIENGQFTITTGGGSSNSSNRVSNYWGQFNKRELSGNRHVEDNENNSSSIKGIKSNSVITINNGNFTLNCADDAIHSNASVMIHGGVYEISSGDDGFHAEEDLQINNATINIKESYEGLEALHIKITDGDITINASDDGLNAAGGMDYSGVLGGRDGMFGKGFSSNSNGSINILDGTINIIAYGDGLDANGSLDIKGGLITVTCPVNGDTAIIDYDTQATISEGTFIGTGAVGMAQTFSDSKQGVIAVRVGTQPEGTEILLVDNQDNMILEYTPTLSFGVVIISSADIVKGEIYNLWLDSNYGKVTAN